MVTFLIPGTLLKITLARAHHNFQSIALGVTKTSFGITLLRLMPGGWEAKVIWVLMVTMNLQFAVHIIATWQAICGAEDQGHIGGDSCWHLPQSVTFTVFSAGKLSFLSCLFPLNCDISHLLNLFSVSLFFFLKIERHANLENNTFDLSSVLGRLRLHPRPFAMENDFQPPNETLRANQRSHCPKHGCPRRCDGYHEGRHGLHAHGRPEPRL